MNGTPNEVGYFNGFEFTVEQMLPLIPVWGTDLTYNHFAVPWAFAMDTPYRWVKQVASHLGGTRTGMVMTWPKRITDTGRHPQSVPSRHRRRSDDPERDWYPAADHDQRHCAAPLRWR